MIKKGRKGRDLFGIPNKKIVISIGFMLEVSLFVTSGWLFGRSYHIIGIVLLLLGLSVALFVGELIKSRV